jgi:cell division transport system permease protein
VSTARSEGAVTVRRSRLAIWREQHAWSLRACLERLGGRPFGTFMTMAVLGLAMALPLALWLLLGNARLLTQALGDGQSVSVFMRPQRDQKAAEALAAQLRQRSDIAAVTLKSPQQGLTELAAMQGFGDALATLEDNPLPWVLLVEPREGLATADVGAMAQALRKLPGVDLVQDDGAFRDRMHALLALGTRALLLLAALLALAVLLVVGNTVRMDIRGRAEEIAVLQLAGASTRFVRRPYLYAGFFYGLGAGIVAVLLLLLLEAMLAAPVARLVASYGGRLEIRGVDPLVLLAVPLAGAVLGWLGARLVSARRIGATLPR